MNLLALSGISMESYYDRSHSFNKNTIIFMIFFTYKYLNVEKITSKLYQLNEQISVNIFFFSGSEKAFKLELFLTEI